ncbi:hypothetical protein CALVIDRAFT_133627 [Calocera viscosa TUFC12733]|uniref:Terpenoid synthase n=1 Tax=Calocera viscosa (strain TUFC12733) TaxID=1330018 RepID=A0A167RXA0_CALVF|nr:hypothetical protein CALVIDRAFT_133627 [Calocera viscosa TUFC12733]
MRAQLAGPSVRFHARRRLSTTPSRRAPSHAEAEAARLKQAEEYCRALTRGTDHPAFLTSYFYPGVARPAFYALHAFHAEIAQVRRKVSKEILGEMRYTWWRDAVKSIIAGHPPSHPVCLSLSLAHTLHHLQPYHLTRLITAYSHPLPPCPDLADLRTFAQSTRASLMYLCLGILPPLPMRDGAKGEDRVAHAASHVGQAVGLAGVLRSAGAGEGPMGRSWQGGEELWRDRVKEVASAVREEVGRAREVLGGEVGREKMPVFLSAVPALVYVDRLEKAGGDPRVAKARGEDWRTSWRVWRAWRSGVF